MKLWGGRFRKETLIVPAAGGVEALACRADLFRQEGFHVHMDVLVVGGKFDFSGLDTGQNVFQALNDLFFPGPPAGRPGSGQAASGNRDARLYPFAEGAAGFLRAAPAGLRGTAQAAFSAA